MNIFLDERVFIATGIFLILCCSFETASFKNTFSEHIVFSPHTYNHMCNFSGCEVLKRKQNLIFARCYSNTISAFDGRQWLQFTETHSLEKSWSGTYFFFTTSHVRYAWTPRYNSSPLLQSGLEMPAQSPNIFILLDASYVLTYRL